MLRLAPHILVNLLRNFIRFMLILILCTCLFITYACESEDTSTEDQPVDEQTATGNDNQSTGDTADTDQCLSAEDLCTEDVCENVVSCDMAACVECPSIEDVCTEEICNEIVMCSQDGSGPTPNIRELNLNDDADNLYAWRKTRASLDPNQDVVFYWQGYVYNVVEQDERNYPRESITFEEPLFKFEGFNVARFAEVGANSYEMLSREVSVYQNPDTGEIIDCWRNALLPNAPTVRVMHVANDPVNFGVGTVDYRKLGDRVSFFSDVLLAYRSPLADNEAYAPYSASNVYQSNELFNFYVNYKDLENEDLQSVPVEISWSRIGQYLPWMQMGDRPGQLIYHVRGFKVLGGVDNLPQRLREWTINVAGEKFLRAPETVPTNYQPNATTWRVFKSALDAGEYQPECE